MFNRKRVSRPTQATSYTGVSNISNGASPASGALAAASVIGKALKDNNHNASGLTLPQQQPKGSNAHRAASLLGTRRDSLTIRSNSVTGNPNRPTPRTGSLNYHPSSPITQKPPTGTPTRSTPTQKRTQSLTSQPSPAQRLSNKQSAQSLQQQQKLKHRVSFSADESTPGTSITKPFQKQPAPRQSVPATPKMIKKWVPSAHGLVCVEVPAPTPTPTHTQTTSQRAIARSSSMNSLSNNTRNGMVKRASSLTGPKPSSIPRATTKERVSSNPSLSKSAPTNPQPNKIVAVAKPQLPAKQIHTHPVQTVRQKASLQSMNTQGHSSFNFEPTIIEDEDDVDIDDNFKDNKQPTVQAQDSNLDQMKDDYLDELENDRLNQERLVQERDMNEKIEMIERERAYSAADEPIEETIYVPSDVSKPIEDGHTMDDEIENEEYTESERLLAEQRLEELVKLKEQEIMEAILKQRQLEGIAFDSSLVSVASSTNEDKETQENTSADTSKDLGDDDECDDYEGARETVSSPAVESTTSGIEKDELSTPNIDQVFADAVAPIVIVDKADDREDIVIDDSEFPDHVAQDISKADDAAASNFNNPLNDNSEIESEKFSDSDTDGYQETIDKQTIPADGLGLNHPQEIDSKASVVSSNYNDLVNDYAEESLETLQLQGNSVSTDITSHDEELTDAKTPTADSAMFEDIKTPAADTALPEDSKAPTADVAVFEDAKTPTDDVAVSEDATIPNSVDQKEFTKPQSMAQRLRPTLGVSSTPESKPAFEKQDPLAEPIETEIGTDVMAPVLLPASGIDDVDDIQIPERSHKRISSVSSTSPIDSVVSSPAPAIVEPEAAEVLTRRKSALKKNNSSRLSLNDSPASTVAYLSGTTAENTRLNAMASSSSLNLSAKPQVSPKRMPEQLGAPPQPQQQQQPKYHLQQHQNQYEQPRQQPITPIRQNGAQRQMRPQSMGQPPNHHQQQSQFPQRPKSQQFSRPSPQQQQGQRQMSQQFQSGQHHHSDARQLHQLHPQQQQPQLSHNQQQQPHQKAGMRASMRTSTPQPGKRISQYAPPPIQEGAISHHLAAATKAAQQHNPQLSQQPKEKMNVRSKPRTKSAAQQRASQLYEKANKQQAGGQSNTFYNNPYPEHLKPQLERTSSFEKEAEPVRKNRLTLRDDITFEQPPQQQTQQQQYQQQFHQQHNQLPPSQRHNKPSNGFKSRFDDSDSDSESTPIVFSSSNGHSDKSSALNFKPSMNTVRSVSAEQPKPKSNPVNASGNGGTRFFSEQIPQDSSHVKGSSPKKQGGDDEKKKRFGKLRKLFGNK